MNKKGIISKYDLFVLIVTTLAGTSIFAYPRILSEKVGTDGWIVIILSGLVMIPILYMIHRVVKLNDYSKFTDMLQNNFGDIIGKIVGILMALSSLFIISMEMRVFTEVLKMYLLKRTPAEFIILVMILVGIFLIRGEIESVVRFNEITFWLMFLPITIAILFVLKGADFTNIFPILSHEPIQYLIGMKSSVFAFVGFQIVYVLYPLMNKKEDTMKVTIKSLIFIAVFYVILTVATIFVFSNEYVSQLLWPPITMLSAVNIPGTFIERWEGIIMAFWLIFFFTTYVNLYYFSSEIVKDIFHLEDIKISLVLVTPILYILSLYPQNIAEIYDMKEIFFPYIGLGSMVILPIILLITGYVKIRRVKDEI